MEERFDEVESNFKMSVFANNPKMYQEMFLQDPRDELNIAEFEPQNEEDVKMMLRELKKMGWD